MAFFCAGSQAGRKKREMSVSNGSRAPVPRAGGGGGGAHLNGHAPHASTSSSSPMDSPVLSHASSIDLPQTRKMVVLLDYSPDNPQCLAIKRGESVQVVRHEGDMALVRNERGKEGFVPKVNLFAPYSRRPARGSVGSKASLICEGDLEVPPPSRPPPPPPMFHVASVSSLMSQGGPGGSGGGYGASRAPAGAEQASSPPAAVGGQEVVADGNGAGALSSEQRKCSPSSSSGVASSLGSSHHDSQVPNGGTVRDQRSSFSSLEDDVLVTNLPSSSSSHYQHQQHRNHTSPLASSGDGKKNTNTSSDETISRGTNSPSLSSGSGAAKHRPLPPPPLPPPQSAVPTSLQASRSDSPRSSASNGRAIREEEQTPPPIPPRDVFVNKVAGPREGEYSSPADALHPNASHQERLAHYQRDRPRERERERGDRESAGRVRSATMQRSKPYNRQVPSSSTSGNFEADYMPPIDAHGLAGRRRYSEEQEGARDKVYTDSSTAASSLNGDVFVTNQGKVTKFKKSLWGLFVVAADFAACDENEISVSKNEHVSVWNRDDPDWFWVMKQRTTGDEEGFVPSCCLREMAAADSRHAATLESLHHHHDAPRLDPPPTRTRAPGTSHAAASSHRNSSSSSHQNSTHRARLNSDGSMHNKAGRMGSSNSSIDRVPVQSPPSPPPPYTEYDSGGHRGVSLSQQDYSSHPQSLSMSRTHSQGHASTRYRNRLSANGDHHSREARENRDSHRVGMDGPMVPDGTLV